MTGSKNVEICCDNNRFYTVDVDDLKCWVLQNTDIIIQYKQNTVEDMCIRFNHHDNAFQEYNRISTVINSMYQKPLDYEYYF